jgi:hypothetical protein
LDGKKGVGRRRKRIRRRRRIRRRSRRRRIRRRRRWRGAGITSERSASSSRCRKDMTVCHTSHTTTSPLNITPTPFWHSHWHSH